MIALAMISAVAFAASQQATPAASPSPAASSRAVATAFFTTPPSNQSAQSATNASPSPSPSTSTSPLATIGTVSTADRSTSPLASVAQTTYVVSKAQIEAAGYQTVADAIRYVPGMTFFQYGGFGSQANFGTLGSNQPIVLLNGNPITAGSTGQVNLDTLTSTGVQRIEIVESGGSTLYGSNGAGGIINIITSVPRAVYLKASYGSFGDRDVRVEDGNGTFGVSLERHVAINDYPYPAENGLPAGVRYNDAADTTAASFEYYQPFGNWNVRATARLSQLDLEVPGAVTTGYYGLTADTFDPSNRNDLSAKLTNESGKFTTSITASGFRNALFDNNDDVGLEDSIIDSRANLDLEEVVRESPSQTLVSGVDLSRETLYYVLGGTRIPPAAPSFGVAQSQAALYAQQSAEIGPNGKVYAGLRGENDSPAGSVLEPSAGFKLPIERFFIGGNAASSYFVPTLLDLYYPRDSNPNLLPERDRNLNLVFSGPTTFFNPSLTIFERTADDLIEFSGPNYSPINAGRAHFQGYVVSVQPHIGPLVVQASLTDLPTATQVNEGVVSRVNFEPILQGTLTIDRPFANGKFGYGFQAKSTGAHTENFPMGSFGQYTTFDAYVRYRVAKDAVLTARLFDVGNEYAQMFATYPVPAQAFRIELSTR